MKKLPIILASLSVFLFLGITVVLAQGSVGGPTSVDVKLDNPFGANKNLFTLVRTIINDIILPIGGVIAVLAFIYSGFKYVTAQGDVKKIEDAHKALLATTIGTAVLLGAWVLATVVCKTIALIGGPACPI